MGILSLRGYPKVLSIGSKVLSIGPMLSTLGSNAKMAIYTVFGMFLP